MNKFKIWYLTYQKEITWFIIGWLGSNAMQSLFAGDYIRMLISLGFIWLNLALNK
jgi:hypothetical protein